MTQLDSVVDNKKRSYMDIFISGSNKSVRLLIHSKVEIIKPVQINVFAFVQRSIYQKDKSRHLLCAENNTSDLNLWPDVRGIGNVSHNLRAMRS